MYLLLGYGKSNQSIEKFLIKNNYNYVIYDDKKNINKLDLSNIKIIIKSNGIMNNHFILEEARKLKIKIISDLQLFYNINNDYNYCLVTGSNGKTTIVSLLERCLNNTVSIGNNGLPFFNYINTNKNKILEVSSFMLENINYINYKYNIISNIYPTHLEHHKTFENYIKCKISFMKYLKKDSYVIYDMDDIILNRLMDCYEVNRIPVSLHNKSALIHKKDNFIYYNNKKIINVNKLKIIGNHNIYNVMLVLGVILNHHLLKKDYVNQIYNYTGEKYRMEIIYNKNGLKIINDSKSTNFKALRVAIESVSGKVLLIVGGKKRNDKYSLIDEYLNKIVSVYCFGENNNEFYNYFSNNNYNIKCYKYLTLEEVVNNINDENIDYILFSPGSVSYDQFIDFEDRGETFNKLIKNKYNF